MLGLFLLHFTAHMTKQVEPCTLLPEHAMFKHKPKESIPGVLAADKKQEWKQECMCHALVCRRKTGRINWQPKTLVISGRQVGRRVTQKD